MQFRVASGASRLEVDAEAANLQRVSSRVKYTAINEFPVSTITPS